MRLHLQEISRMVTPGAHGIVVMDKAGWHTTAVLEVPANLSLLHLPPYSPELNPQENIWQFLRQTYLSNRVLDGYEAIVDACCKAWNAPRRSEAHNIHRHPHLGDHRSVITLAGIIRIDPADRAGGAGRRRQGQRSRLRPCRADGP
jgi:hypothetical protein